MRMFCRKCGKELKHGAVFCSQCGTRQIDVEQQDNKPERCFQQAKPISDRTEIKTVSPTVHEVSPTPQTSNKSKRKKRKTERRQSRQTQCIMLSFIAVVAVVCGVFFYIKVKVNDISASGSNVKWKVDDETLYILGEGKTQKFPEPVLLGFGLIGQPWRDQRIKGVPLPVTKEKQFDKVVVSEGITVIGENFFMGDSFSSVELPDSLIEIGDCSFGGISGLEEIYIPRSVERVYDNAFLNDSEINYRGSISEWLTILYSDSSNRRLTAGASFLYCSDAQLDENRWRDPIRSTNITYTGTLESWFNIIEGYNTESIGLVTCSDGEWDYSKSEGKFNETAEQMELTQNEDTKDEALKTEPTIAWPSATNAQVGDVIIFGTYEQDNDTLNGAESIEWEVLDVEKDRVLLISRYVLDNRQWYRGYAEKKTWEICDLRKWLNDDFYNTAFSEEEQKSICETKITTSDNSIFGTPGGNDTRDRMFCLSVDEVKKYYANGWIDYYDAATEKESPEVFGSNERLIAIATPHAYASLFTKFPSYTPTDIENHESNWILRTPGAPYLACSVNSYGSVGSGSSVNMQFGVRPALWLKR